MIRFAFGLLVLVAGVSLAEEKKESAKLTGTWAKTADGSEIKFKFEEKTLTVTVSAGDNGMTATADYTVDKDGVVKAKVTKVEEKGSFPNKPPKGFEFSMKVAIKDKKATVSDFKSEHEEAKAAVEGEYEHKD